MYLQSLGFWADVYVFTDFWDFDQKFMHVFMDFWGLWLLNFYL